VCNQVLEQSANILHSQSIEPLIGFEGGLVLKTRHRLKEEKESLSSPKRKFFRQELGNALIIAFFRI
jgi:hypothetical protein